MPPTWYLSLSPQQEPFDLGLPDAAGRIQFSCNFLATKRPSASFIKEIIAALVAAHVGTENVNIFATSMSVIPAGDGPFLSLRATGGVAPVGTHNAGPGAYRRPGLQVLVVAATAVAAEAMALAAYDALVAVQNRELSA